MVDAAGLGRDKSSTTNVTIRIPPNTAGAIPTGELALSIANV
jgi:hypothetical protein